MHIAILITNTDDSAFARTRPDDGAKFTTLLRDVRPHWTFTPHWVCRDEFPAEIISYDGVLLTGSPASVHDDARWIATLETLVRDLIARGIPLFGACFGHQIIAKALGADIVRNPTGWGHGRLIITRTGQTPWAGPEAEFALYGSHIEQVATLPTGARAVFTGETCPIAGFAIGDTVFTVQHHPEMTHDFISDLVEHYADHVGPDVTETARASLARPADRTAFAEEIARFFEHAATATRARSA